MQHEHLVGELRATQQFLNRSTETLTEADSAFVPAAGMFSVAGQMAHIAQTIDWFTDGVLLAKGFDMDFPRMEQEVRAVTSLDAARGAVAAAFDRMVAVIGAMTPAALAEPIPPCGIMDGQPRWCAVGAVVDHTAHHRGALTVYARLLGRVPAMPYA